MLKTVYYTPSNPGSYGGKEGVQRAISEKTGARLKDTVLTRWLSAQDTYTLHKPVPIHFKRNRVFVLYIDQQWEADLCDMTSLADHNDGYKFMLTCIDSLSKYAWVRLLKNKSGAEVTKAFEDILATGRKPTKLRTDKGK